MSADPGAEHRSRGGSSGSEDPLEVRRYFDALRRNRLLIAAIVVIVTGAVIAISLVVPKTYDATIRIVVDTTAGTLGSADAETVQRQLATTETLATTDAVLAKAARAVPGTTVDDLSGRVSAAVDQNANIIDITVSADTAGNAARLANAMGKAFIEEETLSESQSFARAERSLTSQIQELRAGTSQQADAAAQIRALEERLAELRVAATGAGSDLKVVQPATAPSSATSPRPLRNAVIAFFAAIFLGVLVALGRDQLTPRINNQRELGRLLGLPVLSGIPYVGRRRNARNASAEYETYQTLSAATRLALPPDRTHIVLVTSATHGEGKTTVSTRLARLLAQAGHRTLVVSGDLRWPRLDEAFGVADRRGMRDLLAGAKDASSDLGQLIRHARGTDAHLRAALDVLPAGQHVGDASALLTNAHLEALFSQLRTLDYAYILVDSPPLLGVADSQVLARMCDQMMVVARLDRLTMNTVVDLREMIDRLAAEPLGLVVIGARLADSPYYWSSGSPSPMPA